MMDVAGLSLTQTEAAQLAKPTIGGVILFTRNYQSRAQIQDLIGTIRQINPDLLIAVDHEGGRVQRFRQGFTQLPAMALIGELYENDPAKALTAATACGGILAGELLEIGVDFSFAPVLDLAYDRSAVIGNRAFHANPEVVIKLAGALIEGMHTSGMRCVGKHFPGHGFVVADSHLDLPIDERPRAEIERDMSVFQGLIGQGLDAVMPAHIIYPQVNSRPAGFSSVWLKTILRTQLGFDGVVFSDDLSMQGALFIADIEQRVQVALESGCDMVLICNRPDLVAQIVDKNWQPSAKLSMMKGRRATFDRMRRAQYLTQLQPLKNYEPN